MYKPVNGIGQKINRTNIEFIASDSTLFQSATAALKFLETSELKTEAENLETFCRIGKNQNTNLNDSSVSSSESWQNFEEELLIGWKRKVDGTEREHFMSPSGDRFKGRFRVIKYLKEKDVTGEIVAAMRKIFGKGGKLLTSKSSEVSNDFKEMKSVLFQSIQNVK